MFASRASRPWGEVRFLPSLALRMAWTATRRNPGPTVVAVGVLILGFAAPATFFSLLSGAIRPLPVPEGDRVVKVDVSRTPGGARSLTADIEDLESLQDIPALSGLGGFRLMDGVLRDAAFGATRVSAAALTSQVLPLLRVQPSVGRIPSHGEEAATLLLGHRLWEDLFDGDPGVLGRVVELNGSFRTIVGILPDGFAFPFRQDLWVPLVERPGDTLPVELVGRLAEGVSEEQASLDLSGRWARRDGLRPRDERGGRVEVRSFTRGRGERGEGISFLALVLVALALLLIACANVANLLLVRATERVRTLAVQSALGASRLQLGAQLLLEAFLIALLGGIGGLLVAWMAVEAIESTLGAEHFGYFWMHMAVDGRVLGFTGALVGGTAVLAGTLPVVRIFRANLQGILKEGGAGASVTGGGRWSRGFVTAQLALSCSALVAAGLTGRSLAAARHFGDALPGREVVLASVAFEGGVKDPLAERSARIREAQTRLAHRADVRAVAFALGAPGYMERWSPLAVEGSPETREQIRGFWNAVTPGYSPALDLDVRRGRGLEQGDDRDALPVAVVNEAFVRRRSPIEEILGRRVRVSGVDTLTWFTIVGIVENVDLGAGDDLPRDRVYLSLPQVQAENLLMLVRAGPDPLALAPAMRQVMAQAAPGAPLWGVRTLSEAHAYMIRVPRTMSFVALGGGFAGLLVAGVGLYALLAFLVRQRRRELGIRVALGADGTRLAVGVGAAMLPAVRAARVEPIDVLRRE